MFFFFFFFFQVYKWQRRVLFIGSFCASFAIVVYFQFQFFEKYIFGNPIKSSKFLPFDLSMTCFLAWNVDKAR